MSDTIQLISNEATFTMRRDDAGVYRVFLSEQFIGFVERAGTVYVALAGTRYDRAVEAGQALSLATAASMLKSETDQRLVYS
jgi:hypothetical protein